MPHDINTKRRERRQARNQNGRFVAGKRVRESTSKFFGVSVANRAHTLWRARLKIVTENRHFARSQTEAALHYIRFHIEHNMRFQKETGEFGEWDFRIIYDGEILAHISVCTFPDGVQPGIRAGRAELTESGEIDLERNFFPLGPFVPIPEEGLSMGQYREIYQNIVDFFTITLVDDPESKQVKAACEFVEMLAARADAIPKTSTHSIEAADSVALSPVSSGRMKRLRPYQIRKSGFPGVEYCPDRTEEGIVISRWQAFGARYSRLVGRMRKCLCKTSSECFAAVAYVSQKLLRATRLGVKNCKYRGETIAKLKINALADEIQLILTEVSSIPGQTPASMVLFAIAREPGESDRKFRQRFRVYLEKFPRETVEDTAFVASVDTFMTNILKHRQVDDAADTAEAADALVFFSGSDDAKSPATVSALLGASTLVRLYHEPRLG